MRMKIAMLATAALCAGCLGLFGCSSGGSASDEGEAAPAEASQEEAVETDFPLTIDGCTTTTDYEGNPAIIVTYTWTNNSDEAQMFSVAIDDKAFQNGVELDFATIMSTDGSFDAQAAMNEIKPGATQTVQQAFLLDDQSDVTVECTEMFDFSDTVLAEQTFSVA